MTECVKIKCDDCKFVEDCVDYGWDGCKKFTPTPSEPMTKLCNSCEYLRYCARSGIEEVGCDRYKRDTTTNEEWFCRLPTEERAEFLMRIHANDCIEYPFLTGLVGARNDMEKRKAFWLEWLKEKHNGNMG